jgi:hypothetical protein
MLKLKRQQYSASPLLKKTTAGSPAGVHNQEDIESVPIFEH